MSAVHVLRPVAEADPAVELMKRFFMVSTHHQLIAHAQREFSAPSEGAEIAEGGYSEEMSILMMWGQVGACFLKLHFDLDHARALYSHALKKPESEVTNDMARDFMNEMSNLQGGYIRGVLNRSGVLMGMSLPFRAVGKDEVAFRKIRDPRATFCLWSLTDEKGRKVTCTAEIYLADKKAIEDIRQKIEDDMKRQIDRKPEDDGDVNFF